MMGTARRWRVWSWHEGEPITIVFDDGQKIDAYAPDDVESEEWDIQMSMDSTDDVLAAGWKTNPETDIFEPPEGWSGDSPTRWRPESELPSWMPKRKT